MSFIADKIVMDGLTYDDVLLIPAYSEVLPKTVELTTKFSRNIELKVPFVTAAMDTVTEAKMAIAIAREGGIGVIHKNMSIEEQARQVAIVKRAENGMIYDPVTIKRGSTVRDALALMSEYRIGGIPVVDDERYLVGIVTNRDLRFEKDMDKRIDEVMTKENIVTTNQSTDMEAASQILQEHKMTERNVSNQNLCIRVWIQRTFLQHIRMQQIHLTFSRFLFPFFSWSHLSQQAKAEQAQDTYHKYPMPARRVCILSFSKHILYTLHYFFTQPGYLKSHFCHFSLIRT